MVSLITSCKTQFISTEIILINSNVSGLSGWINESIDKGMDEKLAEKKTASSIYDSTHA
jgi:hypothetical protein